MTLNGARKAVKKGTYDKGVITHEWGLSKEEVIVWVGKMARRVWF